MGGKKIYQATKIDSIQFNTATYGTSVPVVFGTERIAGNIIDHYDLVSKEEVTDAGKGGNTYVTGYQYFATLLIGLAEGPCSGNGIKKVWQNEDLITNPFTLKKGQYGQTPWSYTLSKHPDKALPYSGLCYVAAADLPLSANATPNVYNFEYQGFLLDTGDGIDANPADVIKYILTDPLNGVGIKSSDIDEDSLEQYRRYCAAADLLISAAFTEDKKAYEIVNEICEATNTLVFWSQNKLKFVPKCHERLEHEGQVYDPDTTPIYDLDVDDFIADEQLVIFERADNTEAYNHVSVEYPDRANNYEKQIAEAKIDTDVNIHGYRSKDTISIPYYHTKARAEYIARAKVMECLYGRNRYTFKLGWTHCFLEPGDLVTIYDPVISPNRIPVMIEEIQEDADGGILVVAVSRPLGISSAPKYETYEPERPTVDFNVSPGDAVTSVCVPSPEYTGASSVIVAASGGDHWGGCDIWVSDNGEAYKKIGTVNKPSTHGVLTADLPLGNQIDVVNELQVELYYGQLHSVSPQDAQNLHTLCYVDGELMAYQMVTLTGPKQYTITYLLRGLYNTPIQHHPAGSKFIRLNDNVFRYDYDLKDAGKTIYFKAPSFNPYGSGRQGIEEVVSQTLILPGYTPPEIMDLTLTAYIYDAGDGTALSNLTVTFTAPEYSLIEGYNIYYTYSDEDWIYAGTTRTNTYTIPALPKGTVRVMVTTLGLRTESSGVISDPYTLSGKLTNPEDVEWIGYELGREVLLKWKAVSNPDVKAYEVRTDENFGELEGLVFLGDALSCRYKLTGRNQTLYIKALNRSGIYSVNATPLVIIDEAPSVPPAPEIQEFFSGLKIRVFAVTDPDIVSYNIHLTPCDENGLPTGEPVIVLCEPFPGEYFYEAHSGSSFLVQVAACDTLGEGEKTEPILATARFLQEVEIPDGLLDQSKLTQSLAQKIDSVDELSSEIQQLSDEITLKVQYNQDGKMIVTGIGVASGPEGGEVAIMADRFRVFSSASETGEGNPVFVVDSQTKAVYLVGDLIADGTITARMISTEELVTKLASIKDAYIDSANIISVDASKIKVGGNSAPIPLAIQPGDTLFRLDGSLLSTQGLKPLGME